MKKIIAFTLALVMLLFCVTGCSNSKYSNEVVMTVNGVDVTWDQYMFWIGYAAMYLNYQYSSYGGQVNWTEELTEGVTAAQWCVDYAKETVIQKCVIESKCREKGVSLVEEDDIEIQKTLDEYKTQYCGENATDAQFEAYLKQNQYSNIEVLRNSQQATVLTNKLFTALFGENGANISDEELVADAAEQGYTKCNHILFLFNDENGEERSDAEKAAGKAKLEGFIEELNAIEDTDARYARFLELKEANCEDNGTEAYQFAEGVMMQEFYDMSRSLEPYAMDIAETSYGYHLIIGLPLDPEYTVTSQSGAATLRDTVLNGMFEDQLLEWQNEADVVMSKEYEDFDFSTLFGTGGFIYQSWSDLSGTKK